MSSRSSSSPLKSVSVSSSSWYSSVSGLFIVYIYLVPISSAPSFILSISSSAILSGASSSSPMDFRFLSSAGYLALASYNFFASLFIYFIFF